MAATVTRPALMPDGTDREFRVFVHQFLAFADRLTSVRAGFAARIGLPGAAYTLLIALARLEAEAPGIAALAAHLHVSTAFVTTEMARLQRLGFVQKRPHPSDGRRVVLSVTPAGRAALVRLAPVQAPVNDALFAALDADDFRRLATLLPRMVADGDAALALIEREDAA
ncbi:MarR family winged helix-turn-helix transcriptional regulator [Belnapia rosea]|uniref:MarR family winged helix-turn-helix transcriptional regulator n=1 Tax=Belnapia rosea TaxID=938405 RepID=UPI000885CD48|nr:MarR family winged helix-turn-helix transcriptional regulator [Belnapia rosea]SDB32882.1 DNA-binding transcriptional regulator, MarR family [Belnapia rosea]